MSLKYREDYWDAIELRSSFIKFLRDIHNLDLSRWNELGYWDYKYRPFSYFDNERLVSNVCLYSMDMMIRGQRKQVAQISAVGTLPEFRGRGLSSDLTERAMGWAAGECDFFFLFADEKAASFYQKRGFLPAQEYKSSYPIEGAQPLKGARKLNPLQLDDRNLIYRIACRRQPVSEILGVFNVKLFMFHCLYFLKDNIFYIDELDALILYKRNNNHLIIFDVAGENIPRFSDFYRFISDNADQTVEFMFIEDRMGMPKAGRIKIAEENGAHVSGNFPLNNIDIVFPYTGRA